MKLKHLEFIQGVISRMNGNSFLIKGWTVTLVSAIFALAADKANTNFGFIALPPVFIFWALDGFFLSQERRYRELYERVTLFAENQVNCTMKTDDCNAKGNSWLCSTFSKTLFPFHACLLTAVLFVIFAIPHITHA